MLMNEERQACALCCHLIFAAFDDFSDIDNLCFLQGMLNTTPAFVIGLCHGVNNGQNEVEHHHQHHLLKDEGQ